MTTMPRPSHSREATKARRLSKGTVVEAALTLIAKDGLEGFSMRALGKVMGVEAMSLYHWFPAKERLLDAIADRLLAGVVLAPTPPPRRWRAWLTNVARAYRKVGLAHPRAFPVLATRRFLSPGATAFLQANIATHIAAGFDARGALRATRSLGAFVNGAVLAEVAPSPFDQLASEPRPPDRTIDARHWVETVAALQRPELDGAFEYGLAALLDGLQAQRAAFSTPLNGKR